MHVHVDATIKCDLLGRPVRVGAPYLATEDPALPLAALLAIYEYSDAVGGVGAIVSAGAIFRVAH
jgi:hypothetical protein